MAYLLMKAFSKLLCLLPPGVDLRIGNLLGALSWLLVPKRRKVMARRNVMLSLGADEAAAERIARRSWTRFGRMIVEVLQFPRIIADLDRYVRIEGRENLDEALAFGRGAVISTAHSGNWELMGAALATKGYPLISVAKKQDNQEMDRLINEYRTLAGQHVTYKTGVREMVRFLGQGKIIGLLMDQDAGKDGVILDFFGRKAACAQGAAFLGRLKNAPILPSFIRENGDGTHTLQLDKPVWVGQSDDKQADVAAMTKTLIGHIEAHIRRYPEEWFWLHDRWKYADRQGLNN